MYYGATGPAVVASRLHRRWRSPPRNGRLEYHESFIFVTLLLAILVPRPDQVLPTESIPLMPPILQRV